MKRVLVTGSSGFIGFALSRRLSEMVDYLAHYDIEEGLDITQFDMLNKAVESSSPDCIFHLAGITTTSVAKTNPCLCYELNVGGTANVLESAARNKIPKVVVASTYLNPTESYSRSKWMSEWLCRQYEGVTVLKHCNVYGPGDLSTSRIIPAIITKLLKGERPTLANGASREFIFIDDVVEEYIACGDSTGFRVRQISGDRIELLELFGMISGIMNSKIEPIVSGSEKFKALDEIKTNGSKIRTSLEDGLKKTIEWYAKHL